MTTFSDKSCSGASADSIYSMVWGNQYAAGEDAVAGRLHFVSRAKTSIQLFGIGSLTYEDSMVPSSGSVGGLLQRSNQVLMIKNDGDGSSSVCSLMLLDVDPCANGGCGGGSYSGGGGGSYSGGNGSRLRLRRSSSNNGQRFGKRMAREASRAAEFVARTEKEEKEEGRRRRLSSNYIESPFLSSLSMTLPSNEYVCQGGVSTATFDKIFFSYAHKTTSTGGLAVFKGFLGGTLGSAFGMNAPKGSNFAQAGSSCTLQRMTIK
jgi:hypothetical protein